MNDATIDHDIRQDFREAMSRLPAGVNVITTDGVHGRWGITASAVCSVTDTPPTMLVCINRGSRAHDIMCGNGRVAINLLPHACQEVARTFAGMTPAPGDTRFDDTRWLDGRSGVPVLADANVSLEGRIIDSKTVGSHSVMFVEVDHIALHAAADGLIYFGRAFHRLAHPLAVQAG
ncbi:flavin reductase [Burkholderia contaminans]|uniref:flavin reductase n=1 Tax=Burkholderia contaminans TaxID=488447 RepID=UPI000863A247|nr:flavin reductase [Burkholderia contaminans]AOL08166.1 FMN reductase [Burkholderia contaminans]ELK6466204.1 flavin reductase [Burkholderia contaminans]MCA7885293.1 flavin reductase [Burkholderia contaminans]MCA8152702.1 flavin reductase [Burkholderia contaminans]RQT04209.1 FMN reductase [Burkholderia contaminans]